ncbi:hypothetical protein GB927_021940 [Shinella sp. CPCC 100929]|uniref:HTH-type transcriptional repressor NicS C-terminal domain-containing protein n=1 Tax=Shinella lacus TaxID=2654216 RepID=A0ABT1RCA2_9HYPH|nr:hypothetical protein [Shinella lacus]MCQ4632719.1 hypothetical protein [Shinella lacus]
MILTRTHREPLPVFPVWGIFRENIDLKHLYISISALGYFYFSNGYTLAIVLDEDLSEAKSIKRQLDQAVEMVLSYLKR